MASSNIPCFVQFIFLAILVSTTCCFGEYQQTNDELRPRYNSGDSASNELALHLNQILSDSRSQHALPVDYSCGGRRCASKDNGAGHSAMGWGELMLGFKHSLFDHYSSLLSMIRNPPNKKQVERYKPSKAEHHPKMLFVFGDSLFDAGNNKYINTDYAPTKYPYGFTYFTNSTGRICDGRILPDFIAEYANLPLIPPSLQPEADFSYGANFASGGAGVLNWTNSNLNMINFMEQVGQFKYMARRLNATLGPARAGEILGQAVYLFSIGGNDYLYYFTEFYSEGQSSAQSDQEQFVKAIVGNITNALIELYGLGARKIAFQNVGPMGCLPSLEMDYPEYNGSCIPVLLSMPILHNKELYEALTDLAELLEGFKFSVMDYLPSLYDRMMDPSKYGFEIGRAPCYGKDGKDYWGPRGYGSGNYTLCEYPSAYVFFNAAHTTQRANEQLAKLLWDGDPSVTRPYTVKQLFEED